MAQIETTDQGGLLERFHIALVAAIERADPGALRSSFPVEAIYEQFVPYRTHRDLIGVVMNGDYEDALMRLLAGEGGYLILESSEALETIREEMEGRNPNTGLFRSYSEVNVRLNPDMLGPIAEPRSSSSFFQRLASEGQDDPDEADEPAESLWQDAGSAPVNEAANAEGLRSEDEVGGVGDDDVVEEPVSAEVVTPVEPTPAAPELATAAPNAPLAPIHGEEESALAEEASSLRQRVGQLEEENQRLKRLLAERVLELDELREQLRSLKLGSGSSS